MEAKSPVSLQYTDAVNYEVCLTGEGYTPLIALPSNNHSKVTIRWTLTWRERWTIFWTGSLWHQVLTFGEPFQPVKLSVKEPLLEDLML